MLPFIGMSHITMLARPNSFIATQPSRGALQIIDIILSCCYIAYSLEAWIAVIVFITLASYIPLTIWLTEWRGQFRRCGMLVCIPFPANFSCQ